MMKVKAILLDADGVLLKKQRYFSDIYSEQYNVPTDLIIPFFKTKFGDCQRGRLDIKEELPPFLKEWGWEGTVDSFLDYWFSTGTEVDSEALEMLGTLKSKKLKCYLATDQEKYRGEYVKSKLGLEKYLDGFFYSCDLGFTKSEADFFNSILNKLNLQPSEVVFVDDEEENVEVAKNLGILATQIKSLEDLRNIQTQYGNN